MIERDIERKLSSKEVVHHLDCDKTNNNLTNLILLADRASHLRLHNWIDSGANISDSYIPKNISDTYGKPLPLCIVCGSSVAEHTNTYCSRECFKIGIKKVNDAPSELDLLELLKYNSFRQIGKLYNVSDNAVRKWCIKFGHDPKTIRKDLKLLIDKRK